MGQEFPRVQEQLRQAWLEHQRQQQELLRQQEQIRQQQLEQQRMQQEQQRQQELMRQQQVEQQRQQEIFRQQQEALQQQIQQQREQEARRQEARRQEAHEQARRDQEARAQAQAHAKYVNNVKALRANVEKEYERALKKLSISKDAKENLERLKKELLDETNYHTSNASLGIAVVTRSVHAICNLILDLVPDRLDDFTPVNVREVLDDLLVEGNFDAETVTKVILLAAAKDKAIAGQEWRRIAFGFRDFISRVAEIPSAGEDHRNLKEEVANQLRQIEQEMRRYEDNISKAEMLVKIKEEMLSSINTYLLINRQHILGGDLKKFSFWR